MKLEKIRTSFQEHLGQEKFIKFFDAFHTNCRHPKRLMYWQQKVWDEFSELHSVGLNTFEEIKAVFMFCRVHQQELQSDVVEIIYGTMRVVREEYEQQQRLYPFSNEYSFGGCQRLEKKSQRVDFCPVCRQVKMKRENGKTQ